MTQLLTINCKDIRKKNREYIRDLLQKLAFNPKGVKGKEILRISYVLGDDFNPQKHLFQATVLNHYCLLMLSFSHFECFKGDRVLQR